MHFNYQHLLRALEVYELNYKDFFNKAIGDDFGVLQLFSRQIIGFMQRSLPAIDRMAFAQGLYDPLKNNAEFQRSFKMKFGSTEFPVTGSDSSHSGLGYEYFACAVGAPSTGSLAGACVRRTVAELVANKTTDLQNLYGYSEMRKRLKFSVGFG
jgi:hypothetical protein